MPTIHKNVEIDLILDSKLFTKTKTYGMAIWEDRHVRGRQFSIEVDVTFSFVSIVHTVAHEMVHVKQWALGEYYAILNRDEHYVFRKETIDANAVDYWELPWEIEAYGRSVGLVVTWIKSSGLADAPWAKEKIFLV